MGNRIREASYEEIPIFFGLLPTGGMWCKHHGDLWFKLYSVLCITAWKAGQELSQERLGDSWDFFFIFLSTTEILDIKITAFCAHKMQDKDSLKRD